MVRTAVRRVRATRYVTPLREGGSLPALIEADDDGLYVLKFRGAGQGPLALAAEFLAGEIGRELGLSVPEIVLVDLEAALGRNEPDREIHDLLLASVGLNLALDYLPGSVMFDQAAGDRPQTEFASQAVWFDGFVTNVDRTARNPNLLRWHNNLYLIDHGASLYFQHNWGNIAQAAESRFPAIRQHVLLPWASDLRAADELLRPRLSMAFFRDLVAELPGEWLTGEVDGLSAAERRDGTVEFSNAAGAAGDLWRRRLRRMPHSFDYAVVRIVPRVEREEFLNAGVVVFCPEAQYLGARVKLNEARLAAFAPDIDMELVNSRLAGLAAVCAGDPNAGTVAKLGLRERFHWIVSPKSTILQVSAVHSGICSAPDEVLARLFEELCL